MRKNSPEKLEPPKTYEHGILKGLSTNVITLGWISFIGDIASEMLYPIMPIFAATIIGIPIGVLGAIEGTAELTSSLLKLFSGALTDQSGKRKPWIFWGYILSALARPIIGFATTWHLLSLGRVFDRVGKGLRTSPRDALLADSARAEYSGKAFGFHRGMDTLGATLGPLITLGLISYFSNNLQVIFFISFIPGLLAALSVLKIREVPFAASEGTSLSWKTKQLPLAYWKILAAITIFSLCNSSDIFIILKLQQVTQATSTVIYCYCAFNLVYALSSPYFGGLSDRIGKKKVLLFSLFIFALAYGLFAASLSLSSMLLGLLLYGFYMAASEGISKALTVDLVPPHLKGTAIGILGLTIGLSSLIASTLGGLLWEKLGMNWTFYLGAVGAVLGFILIWLTTATTRLKTNI